MDDDTENSTNEHLVELMKLHEEIEQLRKAREVVDLAKRLEAGLRDVLRASQIGDAATAIREMRKAANDALYP